MFFSAESLLFRSLLSVSLLKSVPFIIVISYLRYLLVPVCNEKSYYICYHSCTHLFPERGCVSNVVCTSSLKKYIHIRNMACFPDSRHPSGWGSRDLCTNTSVQVKQTHLLIKLLSTSMSWICVFEDAASQVTC